VTNPAGVADAASSSTFRQTARRGSMMGVLFLVALIGSCVSLGCWLPFPKIPMVGEKLTHLARRGDEYDVLFLGSSRIHYQIMPAIFDRLAREQGVPVQSFNAGIGAMVPPEDDYILDRILHGPHRRLRWVFLEIMPLTAEGNPIIAGTGRFAYWHDWERTRLLTDCFIEECGEAVHGPDGRQVPWPKEVQAIDRSFAVWLHNLGLCLVKYSNLGCGQALLMSEIGPSKEWRIRPRRNDAEWDGWDVPDKDKQMNATRRAQYDRDYATLLAEKGNDRFDPGDPVSFKELQVKIDRLQAAGVTPILIIPPTVAPKRYFPPQLARSPVAILDFSDPRRYPHLFTLDHRLDDIHLNPTGAEIFTDLVARQFVEIAKKAPPVP
jgi:hypothetical protein